MTISTFFSLAGLIWPLFYVLVKVSDIIIAEQRKQTQLLERCIHLQETKDNFITYR